MKLGVSTGCFYKPGKWIGTQKAVKIIKKSGLKHIELGFMDFEGVFKFNLKEAKKDLKGFETIGIHMPSIFYRKNKETELVTRTMHYIYKKLGVDYVNVHIDWIKDPYYLKNKKWNVLIENSSSFHPTSCQKVGNFVKKHKFGVLLDVTHTFNYGFGEAGKYVKNLKNKIKVIHLSGQHKRNSEWHLPFSRSSKKYRDSIKPIKKLNRPMMLEAMEKQTLSGLKKEIKKVKEWFNA